MPTHNIKAGIATNAPCKCTVDVAEGCKVQLHNDVILCVQRSRKIHQVREELLTFAIGQGCALFIKRGSTFFTDISQGQKVHTVVGNFATLGKEVIQSFFKSGLEVCQCVEFSANGLFQSIKCRRIHIQGEIGTIGGTYVGLPTHTVHRKRRCGIIGGGNVFYAEFL